MPDSPSQNGTPATPARPLQPRRSAGRWLRTTLKLGLVVAAVALAVRLIEQVGWSALWEQARDTELPLLALATACLFGRFVLMYLRWSQALALLRLPLSHRYGFITLLAAILVNHLTPAARLLGGLVRARFLARRYDASFAPLYGTVLVDQVSHQIVHGSFTWLALAALAWALGFAGLAIGLLASLVALVTGLIIWRRRRDGSRPRSFAELIRRKLERGARRPGSLYAGGQKVAKLFRRAFSDTALQMRMATVGVAVLIVNTLAQWLVFRAQGSEVGFPIVLITVAVGIGAGILTGTPGGLATTEAAMIAAFVALGVDRTAAAAGTLVYRGLHYLLVLLVGLPALLFCEMSSSVPATATALPAPEASPEPQPPAGESPPGPAE